MTGSLILESRGKIETKRISGALNHARCGETVKDDLDVVSYLGIEVLV